MARIVEALASEIQSNESLVMSRSSKVLFPELRDVMFYSSQPRARASEILEHIRTGKFEDISYTEFKAPDGGHIQNVDIYQARPGSNVLAAALEMSGFKSRGVTTNMNVGSDFSRLKVIRLTKETLAVGTQLWNWANSSGV